ncbi:MAG: PLDc_N domain-containing protein [Planctomycetes bacterium]|nr:PLDc_N domain-containing protein [Planctomycetota bacterium]
MPVMFGVGGLFWAAMVLHCLLVQKEFRIGNPWAWLMVLVFLPPIGPWIYLAVVVLGMDRWSLSLRQASSRQVKCLTCKHYLKHDQDGVLCGYGHRQVWKNYVAVGYCGDHTPMRSGRGAEADARER